MYNFLARILSTDFKKHAGTRLISCSFFLTKKGENMSTEAHEAIALIMHDTLHRYHPLHSHIIPQGYAETKHKYGVVFAFSSKADMARSKGFISTSMEALDEHEDELTHWTPNTFGYGRKLGHGIVAGHKEERLNAINTLVIDIDYQNAAIRDQHLWTIKHTVVDGKLYPTLILRTDRGYQIFFVFKQPLYVSCDAKGHLPAIYAAKAISANIKAALAKEIKEVDIGCNDLGICRIPRNDNIVFFEPKMVYSFKRLMTWSKEYSAANHPDSQTPIVRVQQVASGGLRYVDSPWFKSILRSTHINASGHTHGVGRHNTLLTLALACYASGLPYKETVALLENWNACLQNPQEEHDVAACLRDAYSGRFNGPKRTYIDAISQEWFGGTLQVNVTGWYKFARPRERRQNSHIMEWASDIFRHVKLNARGDGLKITISHLRQTLKIKSNESLYKALAWLEATNKLILTRKRGRGGYIVMQLVERVWHDLMANKQAHSQQYKHWLNEIHAPGKDASLICQIDFVLDQVLARKESSETPIDISITGGPGGGLGK